MTISLCQVTGRSDDSYRKGVEWNLEKKTNKTSIEDFSDGDSLLSTGEEDCKDGWSQPC